MNAQHKRPAKTETPVINVDGESKPCGKLLGDGDSNTKLRKNGSKGFLTGGVSLAPAKSAGVGNTCPHASPGCEQACLDHQGRAAIFAAIARGRKRKTKAFYFNREWFVASLKADIAALRRKAEREDKQACVRLNVFSDINWESVAPEIFDEFSDVQFYDYTKNKRRVGQVRPNYWTTFSRSENNESDCLELLEHGKNVTVVFADKLPETWNGYRVIDGDESDLRFEDDKGVVVGLKLKAASKQEREQAIESGFAV